LFPYAGSQCVHVFLKTVDSVLFSTLAKNFTVLFILEGWNYVCQVTLSVCHVNVSVESKSKSTGETHSHSHMNEIIYILEAESSIFPWISKNCSSILEHLPLRVFHCPGGEIESVQWKKKKRRPSLTCLFLSNLLSPSNSHLQYFRPSRSWSSCQRTELPPIGLVTCTSQVKSWWSILTTLKPWYCSLWLHLLLSFLSRASSPQLYKRKASLRHHAFTHIHI